jgi:hypothetical protein
MTTLFSSLAGGCLAPLVISGQILAQPMRDDATVGTNRLGIPSGRAFGVA